MIAYDVDDANNFIMILLLLSFSFNLSIYGSNKLLTVPHVLQLCQRLSDNQCWTVKPDAITGDCHFQLCERYYPVWPQQKLAFLPDLEEDRPVTIKSDTKNASEDCWFFPEVKQCTVSVPDRQLLSRRYVYLQDFPASHAALKPSYGSEILQDNSSAAYVGFFSKWKNEIVNLSCSAHHLTLPSQLRLLASSDCGISDQALRHSIRVLMAYNNTCHLYALHSAMKALSAIHPRSSRALNCHVLDRLSDKSSDETDHVRVKLVLDYIVSSVELELAHYPMVQHRGLEVSKLLAIDSPLVRRLIQETEKRCSDAETVAVLQRAIAAVEVSDKWLFVDRLVSKLYHLYRHIRNVHYRQRLLASVVRPQLRLKLVERILSERCGHVHRLPRQFLTTDSVTTLSSLLYKWLDSSKFTTAAVGNTADQVEEFLAVLVTYVESSLHIHKGL